jgi:Uma2 family endonuclease
MGFRDELVYGRILVSPERKPLHFVIADNIYKLLESAAGRKYWVAQRINLHFPSAASMPSPDVFVIAREAFRAAIRASSYPEGNAAILAVEVLSPSKVHKADEVRTVRPDAEKKLFLPTALGGKAVSPARIFRVPA